MNVITNTGEIYTDSSLSSLLETSSVSFQIDNGSFISMTKTVDKPNQVYFPRDNITFTIRITNTSTNDVNGLFFRDVIDNIVVPINGNNYSVTTTSGIITNSSNPITISGIDIVANGTVIITITGIIRDNF